jgi:hypothetical protein
VYAHAVDPAVFHHGLGLIARRIRQIFLIPGKRDVHVAVQEQRCAIARPFDIADGVEPVRLEFLQVRIDADLVEQSQHAFRYRPLIAGKTGNVDERNCKLRAAFRPNGIDDCFAAASFHGPPDG